MKSDDASYTLEFPADHRHLSDARIESTDWLKTALVGVDRCDEIIEDSAVVVTELASNVIDHSKADSIVLHIVVMPTVVVIEIGNQGAAGAVPHVSLWGVLDEGDRGRGLRIVRSICHEIEISDDGGFTLIRASIDLS